MRERIIQLLGNGVSPAIAASAVGCTESYVSQLVADEEVAARISALRFTNLQEASERDKKADSIESQLLDKLKDSIPMLMRPMDITRALVAVNSLKRRAGSADNNVHIHNQVINLQLPQHTALRVALSANKEIVEVEGRTLVTMPSAQLLKESKEYANLQRALSGEVVDRATDKQAA